MCRQSEDSRYGIFDWVLLNACLVLLFVADCVGLPKRQQCLCKVLCMVSAWYLLDLLLTPLKWWVPVTELLSLTRCGNKGIEDTPLPLTDTLSLQMSPIPSAKVQHIPHVCKAYQYTNID